MSSLGTAPPSACAEYCGINTPTDFPTKSFCPLEPSCFLTPPAGQMWDQQLPPHLQRNRQLHDVLLQREEELLQLQEENQKLREFLSSSLVKNLEVKTKKLTADGRRNLNRELKRSLAGTDEGHWTPPQISKRACRNLTDFCSSSSAETDLDLWVLRVLGLKDRDTIDPPPSSPRSSPPSCSLDSLVPVSSPKHSWASCFGSSCRTSTYQHCPAKSPQNCSASSSPCSDFLVSGTSSPSAAVQSPPEEPRQPLWSTAEPAACWSPLGRSSADRDHNCPLVSPSPSAHAMDEQRRRGRRPSGRCWVPAGHPADVVFSMSLSPSCSVRTHSFPQGQAFVRRNPEGRWNFTWVPGQGP